MMTESLFKIPKWESGDVFDPTVAINAINTMHDRQQKVRENATTIFNEMLKTAQTNKQQELKSYIDAFDLKQLSSPETKSEIFDKINQTNQELGGFSAETLKGLNDYVNFGRSEELMRQWGIKDAHYTKEAELNANTAVQMYKDLFKPTANHSPENKAALETGLAQLFSQGMDDGNPENDVYFNKAFNEAATKALTNLNTQYTTQASLDESIISMFKPQVQEYMDAKLELDAAVNSTDEKTKISKADYDKGIAAIDEQYGYLTPILNNPSIMARIQNKIKEEEVKKLTEEEKAALNKSNIESQINRRNHQNTTDLGRLTLNQNEFIYEQGQDAFKAQQDAAKKVEKGNKDRVKNLTRTIGNRLRTVGVDIGSNVEHYVTADGNLNVPEYVTFLTRTLDSYNGISAKEDSSMKDITTFTQYYSSSKTDSKALSGRVKKEINNLVSIADADKVYDGFLNFLSSEDTPGDVYTRVAFYRNFSNGMYNHSLNTFGGYIFASSLINNIKDLYMKELPKIRQANRNVFVTDAKDTVPTLLSVLQLSPEGVDNVFKQYGRVLVMKGILNYIPSNSDWHKKLRQYK